MKTANTPARKRIEVYPPGDQQPSTSVWAEVAPLPEGGVGVKLLCEALAVVEGTRLKQRGPSLIVESIQADRLICREE